ncbi:MAG TPA: FAD-linked oxidase C-terminal domain-containing protein [Mycobacteriales bacterium]|nr:FAD-linked oxidase C-terminal domain-containing protein [Mycobacteriales bacterium]
MTREMAPTGWGDPARRTGLPPEATAWLQSRVGSTTPASPAPLAVLPPSRLDPVQRAALAATGADVRIDDDTRVRDAAGRSYLDLLALRSGAFDVPDAVVEPTAEQVGSVLTACAEHGVAVVPFGGGTSVVGGVAPLRGEHRAVIALDLRRLDRLLALSETDRTATVEAGLRGPEAEALLNARGYTLGHFPQSYEHATLGGYAATRSAGQASTGYGRFDALVVGLTLVSPRGELVLGRGAASAAGPDLRQLVLGSEGVFGVITSVTVKVRPLPAVKRYDAWLVRSWEDGIAQLRRLEQGGVVPDVARLSDPDETAVSLRLSAPKAVQLMAKGRCLLVLGWEGTEASVAARRRASKVKGLPLPGAGSKWEHGRYDGPYLRDDLLDGGFLVETLETSAAWSGLETTWSAVRTALQDALGECVVMCHVSHLYPHGASLYFTVLGARASDAAAQWQRAKDAACEALVATGATITHHHAVGTDHRRWMTDEVGPLGTEVLRAVKQVLDPSGILNPGKTIP